MEEIIQEFLVESHENLDQLDRDFVELEQRPDSRDQLASVFRTIHTIKGTSGFLAFGNLERVTHVGENLLARLRDGDRRLDRPTTDVLLRMVDAVRACLTEIEATGVDSTTDVSGVVGEVTALLEAPAAGELPAAATVHPRQPSEAVLQDESAQQEPKKRSAVDGSIRVDVDLLDNLMQLVGELVLSRNQILAHAADSDDATLVRSAHRLDLISSSLQEAVMKTRMHPHAADGLPVGQAAPDRA